MSMGFGIQSPKFQSERLSLLFEVSHSFGVDLNPFIQGWRCITSGFGLELRIVFEPFTTLLQIKKYWIYQHISPLRSLLVGHGSKIIIYTLVGFQHRDDLACSYFT